MACARLDLRGFRFKQSQWGRVNREIANRDQQRAAEIRLAGVMVEQRGYCFTDEESSR